MSDTAQILAMLTAAGIDAHDGHPSSTPAGPYAVVYDTTGVASPHRLSTASHWIAQSHSVILVSRTRPGLRHLVATAREALTGRSPNVVGTPLRETVDAPEIRDGPERDVRLSKTLTYSHQTPTNQRGTS